MTSIRVPVSLFCIVLLTACSPARQSPSIQPVALPDISRAAEPVQKQIRERYQSLQAAIERKAPSSELATAFGEMGKLFMAAEYHDAAEACLRNAQQLDSGNMRWPYLLGHVFRYRSDPAKAASFFEQALTHAPQDVPSLVWLADMNLAQNKPDAALEPLTKAKGMLRAFSASATRPTGSPARWASSSAPCTS